MKSNHRTRAIIGLALGISLSVFFSTSSVAAQPNPIPLINAPLVPCATVPGGPSFTLVVRGTGFVSGAVVDWNGSPRATTFVNESQITADILASDISTATTASITVINPPPGGGTSNVAYFSVTVPKITVPFTTKSTNFGGGEAGGGQIAVGDFNGDGRLDVVTLTRTEILPTFLVLAGNGDGTFQVSRPPLSLPSAAVNVVAADFNGDGKLDLAMSEFSPGGEVEVLLGNGDGTFQAAQSFVAGGPQGNGIVAADFNGDGKIDLAVANDIGNSVSIFLGNGDGTFQPHMDITNINQPEEIAVGDFNGDGKLDLAVIEAASDSTMILLGNGDGTFTPGTPLSTGKFPAYIAAADFNGDGKLDLAVSEGENVTDVRVFLGNGDGTFQNGVVNGSSNDTYQQVNAQDINGDGKIDLVVGIECCGAHENNLAVLFGNGDGTFSAPEYYPQVASPFFVAAADFNGDGSMDLISSTPSATGTFSILLQTPAIFSPGKLSFGTMAVGSVGSAQSTTMTNVGWGPLQLDGVSIAGANAGDFSQSNNCPASLAQSASCDINVTFAPTSDGTRNATLHVTDTGTSQLQGVTLKGTGTFAGLSPTSVNFGTQAVGTSSNPQTVTLTNLSSSTALQSIKIAFTGSNTADFSETSNCGSTLAVGANCAIKVTFTPHATGARGASLNVRLTGTPNPAPVPLRGTGD